MSAVAARLPLADAIMLADELVGLLDSSCEQITVAGSIRRQDATVGDIDLVAVPTMAPVADMFGATAGHVNVLNYRLDNLCGEQVIHQARRDDGKLVGWGPRLRHFTFHDVKVQCQSVEPDVYGMWLLIRTGPSDYSHAFVTHQGQQAALRNRDGQVTGYRPGLLPPGWSIEDGFRLHRAHVFIPTPTEQSVYAALGRPYPPPEHRR